MTSKHKTEPVLPEKLIRQLSEISGDTYYSTEKPENELGKRLEHQRTANALTQGQLSELTKKADETGKGISRSAISLYEIGRNRPGIKEIRMLCEVLKISPTYLIFGDEDPFGGLPALEIRYDGVAKSEPEFMAKAVYCLYWLEPEYSMPLVQMMIGMLKSQMGGFENRLKYDANGLFLEMADDLKVILDERGEPIIHGPPIKNKRSKK